jgi:hypothetical protein
MNKVYKIRNKEGLFSTGGMYPSFTTRGKAWGACCDVMNHLSIVNKNRYKGCILMEFSEIGLKEYPLSDKT